PSLRASSRSGMPGPWSSNVSLSPLRAPSASASRRTDPPPPWISVLRASSLAAVTIFVWSTTLKPSSAAHFLTTWRASTTSFSEVTGRVSCFSTGIALALRVRRPGSAEEGHPSLDVQRRPHARQRQPQLDQGDGHGRLHPDHDRL